MSDETRALGTGATCCGTCGCLDSIDTSTPPAPVAPPAPVDEEEPTQ